MLPKTQDSTISVPPQSKSSRGQLADESGLRTPGLLGKYPLIGLVMFLLSIGLFSVLAFNVQTHGPLIQTDTQISNNVHTFALQSSPLTRTVIGFGFYFGEHFILVIGALLALYFLYKRFWPELSMVVIAWLGEGGIWLKLAEYFNRTRPIFDIAIAPQVPGPGFPSGHSFSAVMCYGLLAYLLVPKMPSRFWKAVVFLVSLFIILYIGFSRVFVGDHYPIDVLAGYALGIAWSAFVYTLVELISRRRKQSKSKPS